MNQEVVNNSARYTHPGPPFIKNRSDGRFCITAPIYDANNNKGKAKYGHPVFAVKLRARPCDGAQSPFSPFQQRIFKFGQPYQAIVD